MTQEKSRFTSDRRIPREASWVEESDWSVGTGENVAVDGGDLSPSLPQTTSDKELNGLVYDFEAGTVENWSYTTTHHGSSNWGVSSVAAPDGGEHAIFVSQNSGGGNSAEIYSGPVSYNWAQPYEFEFLVKSDGFKPTAGWLGCSVGWRGRRHGADTIGLSLHNTDSRGNLNPFSFTGNGASNSSVHWVDWKPDLWYWVRGICDEADGTARAKVWADGSAEPSSYQIQADITTGVSDGDVHVRVNGVDSVNLDSTFCHLRFG